MNTKQRLEYYLRIILGLGLSCRWFDEDSRSDEDSRWCASLSLRNWTRIHATSARNSFEILHTSQYEKSRCSPWYQDCSWVFTAHTSKLGLRWTSETHFPAWTRIHATNVCNSFEIWKMVKISIWRMVYCLPNRKPT